MGSMLECRHDPRWSLTMMDTYQRSNDKPLKPRALKRMRQQEAMLDSAKRPRYFPQPEPPLWKPLG